jgi:small-conductance mechanosensitive channel
MDKKNQLINVVKSLEQISFVRILFVIAVAWILVRVMQWLIPWIANRMPGRLRLYVLPLEPILRLLIIVVAGILIVPMVVEPTPQNLIAILGAAGLAVGFAFKDYVSSLIAGIVALYERPYRPGDWVQIDGTYGEIQSLGLRALRLVTPDDAMVIIPHKKIWDTNIHNANAGKRGLLCVADFYLGPDHDAFEVRHKLHSVALTSPYVQLDRPISVIVSEKPWGTHYKLKAYPMDGRDQFQFTSDLTVRGKTALANMGLQSTRLWPTVESSPLSTYDRQHKEQYPYP